MALALALFAMVVIGGLVAGNFLAGLLEQQSGRNLLHAAEASSAAEGELWEAVGGTSAGGLLLLPIGGILALAPHTVLPGFRLESRVARLADNLFLVRARAERQDAAGAPLAERSVGLLGTIVPDSSGGQVLVPIGERAWLQLY
jgi:hypothetical protein